MSLPGLTPGRYRHYKGKDYEVIAVARHSETEAYLVVYRKLYGDHGWWVRPLDMFLEMVEHEGRMQPRFQRLEATDGSELAPESGLRQHGLDVK